MEFTPEVLTDLASHSTLDLVSKSLYEVDLSEEASRTLLELFNKLYNVAEEGHQVPKLKEKLMNILLVCI